MTEGDELLTKWKATYGKLFPRRDPDAMPYTDSDLALAVTLLHEIQTATKHVSVANLRTRTLDRLANYNPKDQE